MGWPTGDRWVRSGVAAHTGRLEGVADATREATEDRAEHWRARAQLTEMNAIGDQRSVFVVLVTV